MKEVQAQVKDKKLSKDLASIYETFLSCPLTLMGTSEKEKTEEKESINISFDITGGAEDEN